MPSLSVQSAGGVGAQCSSRNRHLLGVWLDEWLPLLREGTKYPALVMYRGPCWTDDGAGGWSDWPADSRVMGHQLPVPVELSGPATLHRLEAVIRTEAQWWEEHPDGRWRDAPLLTLAEDSSHPDVPLMHYLRPGPESWLGAVCGDEDGHMIGDPAVVTCPACREALP